MTTVILTPAQQAVLHLLGQQDDLREHFTLSGGTALAAFHLHHRRSDDLDFFSQEKVDDLRVRRFVEDAKKIAKAAGIEVNRIYDRHLFVLHLPDAALLKLEFTHYPYSPLDRPLLNEQVQVESLRDIAADKLAALLDRFEPKDYYDIYFLLKQGHTTLDRMRADLEKKFSLRADPVTLGAACMRADSLPVLPHLLEPLDPQEVQTFFVVLARSLKGDTVSD